jgi:hypothetical protein
MKQPTYSPQEALERVKLMMGYDMSKTLTENQKTIKRPINEDTEGAAVGSAAIGAGTGAALGASALLPGSAAMTGAGGAAYSIGTALLPTGAGVTSAMAVGGAVLGGAAALAVVPLAYWLIRKDSGSAASVKKLFQMCSSEAGKIAKLPRKLDDTKIRNLVDDINDAVNYQTLGFMAGTDEEKLFDSFRALRDGTASDACALISRYNKEHGDLYDDIDGDIDSPDEWKQIYRPLRDCVEDSLLTIKDEVEKDCKSNPNQSKCKAVVNNGKSGGGSVSRYKDCSGTYTYLCKAKPIETVQACLGLVPDGKYGPKTQEKLKSMGYESFKDSDINKICGKSDESQQPEIGGEEITINTSDANF